MTARIKHVVSLKKWLPATMLLPHRYCPQIANAAAEFDRTRAGSIGSFGGAIGLCFGVRNEEKWFCCISTKINVAGPELTKMMFIGMPNKG